LPGQHGLGQRVAFLLHKRLIEHVAPQMNLLADAFLLGFRDVQVFTAAGLVIVLMNEGMTTGEAIGRV
jgi:predicted TIM-barrel enzyme